ncbi:MBL fold metallo-hydrolase [Halobacterium litoreum]|uniref:MBL fold metallo-hydrolase n=1 Tax=Halobacterium litoreum TaxID=2039234 RepID=A0ABD5NIX1_9EURY|nr:MBL fold metallo-hydrolase [Halobacterium litoreum]UHH12310.1 MBL fold metallo-hydrolase [Halobacterium litoreum]
MYHIQLTNAAFEGRNSVYLLGADDAGAPTTLVDTGIATPDVDAELRDALADHGVAFADVDAVLLTHWHHDHAGLAGAIQAESDATVYVHEADAPMIRQADGAMAEMADTQREYLDDWGMPADKQRELLDFMDGHDGLRGQDADVTEVADGETVPLGPYEAEVVHLPGHAAGLVAYVVERDGRREAFVGDAVLPKYTPNVGGADVRVERPLQQYLDSLERVESLDLDRAWPGHRGPIFASSERARDIAAHHDERTERVRRVVAEQGPVSAWEVSAELFGSLSTIHILHGPGEAYAHLDHLVREGDLERTDNGYVVA